MSDDKEQSQPQQQPILAGYYPMYLAPKNDEIDVFELIGQLWQKKLWIVGCMTVTTIIAGFYAFTLKEQWTATVSVSVPYYATISNYYQGVRLIEGNNIDKRSTSDDVAEKLFKQFINKAGSYDELSRFIRNSNYFKKVVEGSSDKEQEKILNEIVDKIKIIREQDDFIINFPAITANDAKTLLEDYISNVNLNISRMQYEQLGSQIDNRKSDIKGQMDAIKKIAGEKRQEEIENIKMALLIAGKSNIQKPTLNNLTKLEGNNLFLLGTETLNAMSENIAKQPLVLSNDYYDMQRQYISLDSFKVNNSNAQAFSYLKSPSEPIKKDKPNVVIILLLGAFLGGCISIGSIVMKKIIYTK